MTTVNNNSSTAVQASLPLKITSTLTSPDTLLAGAAAAGTMLVGASMPIAAVVGGVALGGLKLLKNVVSGGQALRPAVFYNIEPMSSIVRGGVHTLTVPPVLECVKKMDGANARKLQGCLEDILFYAEHFDYTGLTNGPLVAKYKEKANQLKDGEMMALPASVFTPPGHLMVAVIQRKGDKYFVTIHNGGAGDYHHYGRSKNGRALYQTGLTVEGVELPRILQFIGRLENLHAVRIGNSVEKLYRDLLVELQGSLAWRKDERRFWNEGQKGMSCSGFSIESLIEAQLTEEEHQELKARFTALMVKMLTQGVKSGHFWEQTPEHHRILKMMRAQLMGLPSKYIEKDVLDLLKTEDDIEPSLLGKMSGKVETLFWNLWFTGTFRSWAMDDFFHKKAAFDALNPRINKLIKILKDYATSPHYFPSLDEKGRKALNTLVLKITRLHNNVDGTAFSPTELAELDRSFGEFLKAKDKKFKTAALYVENLLTCLDRFKLAVMPHYKKHPTGHFTGPLLKALDCIKAKKISQAKQLLISIYKEVQEYPDKLSAKEIGELCYVLDSFCELCRINGPQTAEQFECFAAMELILNRLRAKRVSEKIEFLPDCSPQYAIWLFQWHLDDVARHSVWYKEMRDINKKERDELEDVFENGQNGLAYRKPGFS